MQFTKTAIAFLLAIGGVAVGSFYFGYFFNANLGGEPADTEGLDPNAIQIYGTIDSRNGDMLVVSLVNGVTHTTTLTDDAPIVSAVIDKDQSALKPGEKVLVSGFKEGDKIMVQYVTIMSDVE